MHGKKPQRERRAAQNFANGGPVRGPGTGTSDSVKDQVPDGTYIMPADSTKALGAGALGKLGKEKVPVNLSNGEFKLPPEQVHAVGVQALDQMRGATHTPTPAGQSNPAKGLKPELFFEQGGVVSEEDLPRKKGAAITAQSTFPGSHPDAGKNIYAGFGAGELGSSGRFARGAESVIAAQPPKMQAPVLSALQTQANQPATAAPVAPLQAAAPQPAQDPLLAHNQKLAEAQEMQRWRQAPSTLPSPEQSQAARQNYLALQQKAPDTGASYFTQEGPMGGRASAADTAASNALQAVYKQPPSTPQPAAAAPTAPHASNPYANVTPEMAASMVAANKQAGGPLPGSRASAPASAQQPAAQQPAAQNPAAQNPAPALGGVTRIDRPGHSPLFTDNADPNMQRFLARPPGGPNAQNMAAADAMESRSQQVFASQMQREQNAKQYSAEVAQAQAINAGNGRRSATLTPAQERERKDMVSALTTVIPGARGITAAQTKGILALQSQELQYKQAGERNDTIMAQTALSNQGSLAAAQMRERGENARTGARLGVDQQRLGLDERRYASDTQAKGFDIRQAERMEKLQNEYLKALGGGDDKASEAAAQRLRAMSGKDRDERLTYHPGSRIKNIDGTETITDGTVFNPRTGTVSPASGGSQGQQAKPMPKSQVEMQDGQVYQTARGAARWDAKTKQLTPQ